jgi:hypothetical protein
MATNSIEENADRLRPLHFISLMRAFVELEFLAGARHFQ